MAEEEIPVSLGDLSLKLAGWQATTAALHGAINQSHAAMSAIGIALSDADVNVEVLAKMFQDQAQTLELVATLATNARAASMAVAEECALIAVEMERTS